MSLGLYLVTDSGLLPSEVQQNGGLPSAVQAAINGGVTVVQMREKSMDTRSMIRLAQTLKSVCHGHAKGKTLFLINDRIDVALAVDADGVHIGQDDMPLKDARRLLGPSKVIGVTCETVEQAIAAYKGGANYIGTSAVYTTKTKVHPHGVQPLGHDGVAAILKAVKDLDENFPVITIGGINEKNAETLLKETASLASAGSSAERRLSGVAVVSAIIAQQDAELAASTLAQKVLPLVAENRFGQTNALRFAPLVSPLRRVALTEKSTAFLGKLIDAFELVKSKKPLVHNITNFVVMRVTADIIIAAGGSPLMAHSVKEVQDIVSFINCLVINIGTLSDHWIEGMHLAAIKANERGVPIVLDPVGAGATPYRMKTTMDLLTEHRIAVVKGNQGEIGAIMGSTDAVSRGVDSTGDLKDPVNVAKVVAKQLSTTVCISGATDYISDGDRVVKCMNGNDKLGLITGTGCSTSALIGCFAGVQSDMVVASVAGTILMGVAAELAVATSFHGVHGPSSFRTMLFDAIYRIDATTLAKYAKLEVL